MGLESSLDLCMNKTSLSRFIQGKALHSGDKALETRLHLPGLTNESTPGDGSSGL